MKFGSLKNVASPYLVMFVLGCTLIIIGLLYIMQSAEAKAGSLTNDSYIQSYLN